MGVRRAIAQQTLWISQFWLSDDFAMTRRHGKGREKLGLGMKSHRRAGEGVGRGVWVGGRVGG